MHLQFFQLDFDTSNMHMGYIPPCSVQCHFGSFDALETFDALKFYITA